MSFYDLYVARDIEDAGFTWDLSKADRSGNCPRKAPGSPLFPFAATGPFWLLKKLVESGAFPDGSFKSDWGSWVARVTKAEIEEFVAKAYRGRGELADLPSLRTYIASLDPAEKYLLVASES